MKLGSRVVAFTLVAVVAFWFTAENSRELVNVDLFLFRVRASLPLVVFGSMLVGMLAVFLVGLRADLQVRRLLARYRGVLEVGDPAIPDRSTARDARAATYGTVGGEGRAESPGVPAAGSIEAAPPGAEADEEEDSSREEGRSDDRARLDAWT